MGSGRSPQWHGIRTVVPPSATLGSCAPMPTACCLRVPATSASCLFLHWPSWMRHSGTCGPVAFVCSAETVCFVRFHLNPSGWWTPLQLIDQPENGDEAYL